MSMELMVKAMKIRVGNPLRKLVLIKLADNASDQGECWPSYQHIADQCEISKRSVMNHIAALCESGLVKKVTRKGEKGNSSNIYLLHPGCTSGDIADAFAGYSRQRVLQSASKLRQSGRVAHRCEGDTRRHFPRLTERAQEPEPQPVRETRPVRNFYVGTNDPRVILCLTRQAEELESRGLYRRAATVWMAAFRESHSQPERNNFLARRERCLRKSSKRAASGEEWYLSGNYVGA
ncbi:TPA: helix-turn-helix domain-containing protein [Escherichia coli]|nr:helix-turn-helix domain-containing protein [Escherichia coli]